MRRESKALLVLLAFCVPGQAPAFAQRAAPVSSKQGDEVMQEPARNSGGGEGAGGGDINNLLQLNLEQLANAPVNVSIVDPVVIGPSKKEEVLSDAPSVVQVITAEEIRRFGAKNLYEVLNWATSVFTTGSYLYPENKVVIRGDNLTHNDLHVLLLINSRPTRDVTQSGHNSPIYMAFPLDAIQRVEIIRGPGSVLYGSNAYSGVINIVTKKPQEPIDREAALAGTFETQKYDLSSGNGDEDSGYLFAATYGSQRGWPFTATGEGPPTQVPVAIRDTVLHGYDDVGIFTQMYSGNVTMNVFYAGVSQTHMEAVPRWPAENIGSNRLFVDFGYLLEHCDCSKTDFHFTYNYDEYTWNLPQRNEVFSNSWIGEITHYRPLTDQLGLIVGGFFDIHKGSDTDGAGTVIIPHYTDIWYSVYAQIDWDPTDWLKIVLGTQGNFPGRIEGGMAPRASAIFTLTENWGAKLLYGNAFRSPYPTETSINAPGILVGNPDLTPETVDTYEVQFSYQTKKSRLAATYFFSEFKDLIGRVGALPATFANLEPMHFQGVELESLWDPNDYWHMICGVTYQQNVNSAGIENATNVPNWQGKLGVAYGDECDPLKVALFYTVFSKPPPVTNVNPAAAIVNTLEAPINLLSLNVLYDVTDWFGFSGGRTAELQFLAQNLLNDDINHPEVYRRRINTLPMGAGRSFYGGISFEY